MPTSEQLEHRKKWVEALRSGKYKQGTAYLCRNGQYCCLGVACEINTDIVKKSMYISPNDYAIDSYNGAAATLPSELQDILGISPYGELTTEWYHIYAEPTLVELNDLRNFTFEEIADVIENNMVIPMKYKEKYERVNQQ